jgi:hypothetical protein
MERALYLFIEFEWPREVTKELGGLAHKLHTLTQDAGWIQEVVAASGGIGGEMSSVWVFQLADYAALERLMRDPDDEISQTYMQFFSQMADVRDSLREQVVFM